MKLSVLALDYDGTIALNDRVPPSVLDAIADARRRNVTVILVTGRILDDLPLPSTCIAPPVRGLSRSPHHELRRVVMAHVRC